MKKMTAAEIVQKSKQYTMYSWSAGDNVDPIPFVRGERVCGQVPCEQYHRVERGHGRFSRAFVLPEPIEVDNVSAVLTERLLTVTIPKAGGRAARKVNVS